MTYILRSHNGVVPFYLNGIFPYAITEMREHATRFSDELLALNTAAMLSKDHATDYRVEDVDGCRCAPNQCGLHPGASTCGMRQ